MKSFLFPDVNVWVALTYVKHVHYSTARTWLDSIPENQDLGFCRLTQIGFLRLLTTSVVMGKDVRSQGEAWVIYDEWLENGRATFLEEPPGIEQPFRSVSQSRQSVPKDWADSYLSAFAQISGVQLVTFDQTLHRRTAGSLLLKS